MEGKFKVRAQYLGIDKLIDEGMFLCGSPATVVEKLEQYQSEMGFGNIAPMLQFGTLPHELTEKNVRLFAAEVMPKLRGLGVDRPAATATAAAE
jgi:alkanesulfonate monooxygenase SsuD/methylene tetrahydromethanopterin reductase-like flavin-dependent oxidoreductase (luciferase family)